MGLKLPFKMVRLHGATIFAIFLYFSFITIVLKTTTLYSGNTNNFNVSNAKEMEALWNAFKKYVFNFVQLLPVAQKFVQSV